MKTLGWMNPMICGLALQAVLPLATRAQGISATSPFLPSSGSGATAPTENSPIEFCGIIGGTFGFFDSVKRVGTWVKLNETGSDVLVRSFDPTNDTATVEYQGRTLTLALKAAKIETAQVVPQMMMAPSVGQRPPVGMPQGPGNVNASAADQQRLEAVAAEVRRRRAQRQAAAQQQPAPQPGR